MRNAIYDKLTGNEQWGNNDKLTGTLVKTHLNVSVLCEEIISIPLK